MLIRLDNVTLSYHSFHELADPYSSDPSLSNPANNCYYANFILDKTEHARTIEKLNSSIKQVVQTKTGQINVNFDPGITDYDLKKDRKESLANKCKVLTKTIKPHNLILLDKNKNKVTPDKSTEVFKRYDTVNALIELFCVVKFGGPKISKQLVLVEFVERKILDSDGYSSPEDIIAAYEGMNDYPQI